MPQTFISDFQKLVDDLDPGVHTLDVIVADQPHGDSRAAGGAERRRATAAVLPPRPYPQFIRISCAAHGSVRTSCRRSVTVGA